jgi:hypothetical protein
MTIMAIQAGGLQPHFWTQQAILLASKEFGQAIKCQSQDPNQDLPAPEVDLFPRK